MTTFRVVIGAAAAGLLAAMSLAAQGSNVSLSDSDIFARPILVAHLRPRVLGDRLEANLRQQTYCNQVMFGVCIFWSVGPSFLY